MNPSTAFATVLADELIRCGLREAVVAPGSRSAPLAMALHAAAARPGSPLRLHVRIDERSAAFLALGLAKASGRPAAVVCTSGTAAAHFHAAVIEASESAVPLLVLTADRPPELRGTGANQTIDQLKLYGGAVRWFCEAGVPENRPGQAAYWRSLACRAWLTSAGNEAAPAGPVHLNLPLRDPLIPGVADAAAGSDADWCEPLDGRPHGAPWTQFASADTGVGGAVAAGNAAAGAAGAESVSAEPADGAEPAGGAESATAGAGAALGVDWTERGVVVAGDGAADPAGLARLAAEAGWPLLAEPSSGARHGSAALTAYQFLLDSREFLAAHQPELVISAGRPGLSRGQLALLREPGSRHIVLTDGPGRWSDPARTATDVTGRVVLRGAPGQGAPGRDDSAWLASWREADAAAREAAEKVLAADGSLSEPVVAREIGALVPPGGLLWVASSMPARDLDRFMAPRSGIRVLASRGASGIDGLVSSAIGAALAYQADGGGPAVALLGDLALLHDAPGLMIGPYDSRPDLCIVVVNNDGGGIFSTLEQAAFPDSFERVFGTPHGADLAALAAAAGLPYQRALQPGDLPAALAGSGLRLVEVRTNRADGVELRGALSQACAAALARG